MNTSMAVVVVFLAALVGVAHPALLRPTPVASTPRAALSMMASPVRTDVPLEGSAKELPSTKTTGSYQLTGDKLYTKKEIPPALGGIRLGFRKLAVVTGASSGLGLWTAKALADKGDYFVICAVRDPKKMDAKAKEVGISSNDYCAMKLELGSFQSVKDFVFNLKAFKSERPLTHLVCNAAVYRPADPEPAWTDDGYEMSVGVNHLGHFLLCNLLLDDMKNAKVRDASGMGAAISHVARDDRPRVTHVCTGRAHDHRRLHHGQLEHDWRRLRVPQGQPRRPEGP